MRAFLSLRYAVPERRAAFTHGLERCGYTVIHGLPKNPSDGDILVSWNLIGAARTAAATFAERGLPVLVTENASWGNDFAGGRWYTIARDRHNTAGKFPIGGAERWDALNVELEPWRRGGDEIVILPQRGIGPAGVAMPALWAKEARSACGGRIRAHPGLRPCVPLRSDLAHAREVWTWGSGAAIKALLWGIPVQSFMPNWIGEQDNTYAGRLAMFRNLAWAQWRLEEIADGEPFRRLL